MMWNKRDFAEALRREIFELKKMPAMPHSARQLLMLKNRHNAGVEDLARIIDDDPSLAAQILRYARLSAFGYGNRITSTHKAITQVLGFDTGLHMALGLSVGKTLRGAHYGPLGMYSLWQHALHSATLIKNLCGLIPATARPPLGLAYLAGLLHNFGFLLLSHLRPNEFNTLNTFAMHSRALSVLELETHLFGIRHDEAGAWLMESWQLPEELLVAVREHHYPDYDGKHAVFAKLVLLADRLLATHGMGETFATELPPAVLAQLSLSEAQCMQALDGVMHMAPELDSIATQMAA